MAVFPTFFLGNIGQQNVLYDILKGENAFLAYKKKKFKESKNSHFSKGVNPWFWSKYCHLFNSFFLGNKGQVNAFWIFYNEKTTFLAIKIWSLNSRKIDIFSQGLTHGFGRKIGIF